MGKFFIPNAALRFVVLILFLGLIVDGFTLDSINAREMSSNLSNKHPYFAEHYHTRSYAASAAVTAHALIDTDAFHIVDVSGRYSDLNSLTSFPLTAYDDNPFDMDSEGSLFICGDVDSSFSHLRLSDEVFDVAWFSLGFTVESWIFLASTASVSDSLPGFVYATMPTGDMSNLWSFGPVRGTDGFVRLQLHYTNEQSGIIMGTRSLHEDTWYHIALSVEPLGTLRMFVDGVLDASIEIPVTLSAMNTLGITIGQCHGGYVSGHFRGLISNLRLIQGRALYTATFSPPYSPLAVLSGTLLLIRAFKIQEEVYTSRLLAATFTSISTLEIVDASGQFAYIGSFASAALQVYAEEPFSLANEGSIYISGGSMGTPYFLSMSNSAFNFAWLSEGFTVEAWVFVGPVSSLFPALVGSMSSSSATNYWSFGPVSGSSGGDIRLRFHYNPSGSGAQFVN
eukprot:gene33110-40052_t